MNFYLLGASVLLLLFWFLLFLLEKLPYLLTLEMKGDLPAYAFNMLGSLLDFPARYLFIPLTSLVLALLVIILNLKEQLSGGENRIALAITFLIFIIYGPVLKILIYLKVSYFLRRGLPRWSVVFFADFLVVLIPCVLLTLSLAGSDYREAFLGTLIPVILLSFLLKFTFKLVNF